MGESSVCSPPCKPINKDASSGAIHASATFPSALYQALDEIARLKKSSVTWVAAEVAEQYVATIR